MWGRRPRPQFNCPYLSVDANSTEFNPESKHPVVCYLPQPRSFLIQSSRRFARTLPTSRVISTGDWNAGAQPGADGRHHALGEEENYFQVQEQRNEYVSSRRQHSLPLSLSDVLWFLIAEKLYGNVDFVDERHRHRFEVEATDRRTDLPSIYLRGLQNCEETLKQSLPDCFLVAGEPRDEGRLWEKRSSVCRPGCWRRENGDCWTGWWVAKLFVSISLQLDK